VVVDNASTDNTQGIVASEFPSVRLVRSENNLGYTGGNNLGIRYALRKENCDYLLILNDDTIIDPYLLSQLVRTIETDSKIGIANPIIIDFESKVLCNSYGSYNFYLGIGKKSLLNKRKTTQIDLLRGTCFLIKREVVEKIGLMDENFFLYFDEADLSYRVKKAGYTMVCAPTARVYHLLSYSFSGKINPIVLYYSTRNELLFARKHLNILFFFPPWIFRFVFRIIQYAVKTRDYAVVKSIMRGLMDFLRGKYGEATFRM
jgi:GT2 family glycosyltransferase